MSAPRAPPSLCTLLASLLHLLVILICKYVAFAINYLYYEYVRTQRIKYNHSGCRHALATLEARVVGDNGRVYLNKSTRQKKYRDTTSTTRNAKTQRLLAHIEMVYMAHRIVGNTNPYSSCGPCISACILPISAEITIVNVRHGD